MDSFKVNDFIILKLEDEKTNIYIKNQLFSQCKFLLLEIPVDAVQSLENINSIDEAAEKLDSSLEPIRKNIKKKIPHEVEFWGHSSNLQVWHENGYDTRLLHSNLAFPLLKRLTNEGDPLARKVFKEEIVKRIESGFPSVVQYLVLEGYLEYLNDDEFEYILRSQGLINGLINCCFKDEEDQYQFEGLHYLLNKLKNADNNYFQEMIRTLLRRNDFRVAYFLDRTNLICGLSKRERAYLLLEKNEAEAILKIWQLMDISDDELEFSINPRYQGARVYVKDKHAIELDLSYLGLKTVPINVLKLKRLEYLSLRGNKISKIPDFIHKMQSLTILNLSKNDIEEIPVELCSLKNIKVLNLSENKITKIPLFIQKMKQLTHLGLSKNKISKIPIELCKLKSLKSLNLSENKITKIPQCMEKLESLERFIIRNNNIISISETILKLKNLKKFDCRQKQAIKVSESIKKEKNIKIRY